MISLNPLVRTAQSLFQHGMQHYINDSDLDKMLTVIHSDNAIELLLKDKVKGFSSIHEKQIPSLLNDLRQDAIVSSLSGDIRLIHEIRNASYHLGISIDTYTLDYVVETAKKLFNQCGLFPNGGEIVDSRREAKDDLAEALKIYTEAKLAPEKRGLYASVIVRCVSVVEKLLREKFEKEALTRFGDTWIETYPDYGSWNTIKLIEILKEWRTFKDPIISLDLKRLLDKRAMIVHTPTEVSERDAYEILQIALHFARFPEPYFEFAKALPTEDAVAEALQAYKVPFEAQVEFRLGKEIFSRFDFVIPTSTRPVAIVEAKIAKMRLDYFKALLFDIELIKKRIPTVKFYIVYLKEKMEKQQLVKMQELSSGITDGFFDLSEITVMLEQIQKDLQKNFSSQF